MRAANENLATLVPNARFFIAKDSGHDIHQDQPELVIEAIRQVATGDPQGAMFALMGPRFAKPVGYFERAEPSDPQSRRWSWQASNGGLSAS